MQCDTQVRESDSVTLREKVTRRRIPAESMDPVALLACLPAVRRLLLIAAARLPRRRAAAPSTGEDRPGTEATLLLDFTPNAVHAGIYMAVDREFDTGRGRRR